MSIFKIEARLDHKLHIFLLSFSSAKSLLTFDSKEREGFKKCRIKVARKVHISKKCRITLVFLKKVEKKTILSYTVKVGNKERFDFTNWY